MNYFFNTNNKNTFVHYFLKYFNFFWSLEVRARLLITKSFCVIYGKGSNLNSRVQLFCHEQQCIRCSDAPGFFNTEKTTYFNLKRKREDLFHCSAWFCFSPPSETTSVTKSSSAPVITIRQLLFFQGVFFYRTFRKNHKICDFEAPFPFGYCSQKKREAIFHGTNV